MFELKLVQNEDFNVDNLMDILANSYIETIFELTFHRKLNDERDIYDILTVNYRFNKLNKDCVNITILNDEPTPNYTNVAYIDSYDLYGIYGKEMYFEVLNYSAKYIDDLTSIDINEAKNIDIKGQKVTAKLKEYKLVTEL